MDWEIRDATLFPRHGPLGSSNLQRGNRVASLISLQRFGADCGGCPARAYSRCGGQRSPTRATLAEKGPSLPQAGEHHEAGQSAIAPGPRGRGHSALPILRHACRAEDGRDAGGTKPKRAKGTRGAGRPKIGGNTVLPPEDDKPPLSDLGISKRESAKAQTRARTCRKTR